MIEKSVKIAICARMGDPLYRPARARLIWAAQTAQATASLGYQTMLVGSGNNLPIKVEGPVGVQALKRLIGDMYNVSADFDVMPLYVPSELVKERQAYGEVEAGNLFPRYVQPYIDLVHTRDPRIVANCINARIDVIYEDHNEDYHFSNDATRIDLNDPIVKGVVAITKSVADRLVMMGVRRSKIVVHDSGVNERAFDRNAERASRWRRSLLRNPRHKYLAVYSGGMQEERGITHIISAAQRMTDTLFVMAGGTEPDIDKWIIQAKSKHLDNVRILGYLPQKEVLDLQQSADVVLMTREPGFRGAISSPLKFVEYLASGAPIVSIPMGSFEVKEIRDCAVNWYDPEEPLSLIPAIRSSLSNYGYRLDGHQANRSAARHYTWQERQKSILSLAGVISSGALAKAHQ